MNKLCKAVTNFNNGDDETAFNEIYSLTYKMVSYTACKYLKNPADIEDAVQDCYIKAFEKLNSIHDADKAMSWMLALARNTCLNKLVKRGNTEITVDYEPEEGLSVFDKVKDERDYHSPESSLLNKEMQAIIVDIVSTLPFEQKDAVMLHYLHKYSIAEVAEMTHAKEGTIKTRLSNARKNLRKQIRIKKDIKAMVQHDVDCQIPHDGNREPNPVTVKNISLSGLLFITDIAYKKDDKLSVKLFLEPAELHPEPVTMDLRVVRVRQNGYVREVGATFIEETSNEKLSKYILENLA